MLWDSKIYLGEAFFNEIIQHIRIPIDMNTLTALKRSSLGLDLVPLAGVPDLSASRSAADHLEAGVPSVWSAPRPRRATSAPFKTSVVRFSGSCRRSSSPGQELNYSTALGRLDPASLDSRPSLRHPARPVSWNSSFLVLGSPLAAPVGVLNL